ncbi:formaldehyde-activating enzyme [Actinoplanes sp. M2I2]|uniref:formaldehyde-activating enzyme n=1 Tax=Actinoplanes sp. M2I2 TaxID=1734444 RepID=UPI00202089A4|nr:formaldehyde-activating enzyme [Actinoplanes sp. M2I2]
MQIGESAHGEDLNAAHVNTVLGPRSGPVGTAWATALATPTVGHVPFIAVLQPSVAAKPFTLFVTKATPETDEHRSLTWGPAQAGVAAGVADAVAEGVISAEQCDSDVIIASVWVNPRAHDADAVYRNNRKATAAALRNGATGFPGADRMLEAARHVANGLYRAPG